MPKKAANKDEERKKKMPNTKTKNKNAQRLDNKSAAALRAQTLILYFCSKPTKRHATNDRYIGSSVPCKLQTYRQYILARCAAFLKISRF